MNLPNYFLADLPAEAQLSPTMITEACLQLRRNRETYLAQRSTQSVIRLLGEVASNWLEPEYPFRRLALAQPPASKGFSPATLARGLDAYFNELTCENLASLVRQDLGHALRLDEFVASEAEGKSRSSIANAPQLLAHVSAGSLPVPAISSMVLGVLLRSAQFVKCASGKSVLPRLFAHSLYEADAKLGACIEVAEWPGGRHDVEKALFEEAECVTATGSDEALAEIRRRVPASTRFISYGHQVSFAYVSAQARPGGQRRAQADSLPSLLASDVAAWDQQGCLSPHVIYVQTGGVMTPEGFAEALAGELSRIEESEPRGPIGPAEAATIASRRSLYEVRAAHSPETRLWQSKDSTVWTVVFEEEPRFQTSCLNRFIYVKSVRDLTEALRSADSVRGKVSTVGLAAGEEEWKSLATEFARWGVTRVCRVGQMQNPPLAWRHDGRPPLGELVVWTDWES